ncbi:F-box/WD repeat-containing protein 10, partial [Borealophlyctis nickersoniae]
MISHREPIAGRRRYVMAWPEDPSDVYLIALDGSHLCWVEPPPENEQDSDSNVIFVRDLDDPEERIHTLQGHEEPISLILTNKEGTLVSYDSRNMIRIWNVASRSCERVIDASAAHRGFIICMNVHSRRIVTGGKNGHVHVWSLDTGNITHTLSVPNQYIHQLHAHGTLNVALHGNRVVLGLYDGVFYLRDLNRLNDEGDQQQSSDDSDWYCFRDDEIERHGFTYAPMTMSMDAHYVITNGAFPDELTVWDLGP